MTQQLMPFARPYAQAAFEYASQQNQMTVWEEALDNLAKIVNTPLIVKILQTPKYNEKQQAEIILALCEEKKLATPLINFIKLLAENRRLLLLPEIAQLFKELLAQQQKILNAHITSAVPLDDSFLQELNQTLNKKLGKSIKIQNHIEPSLLGGLIVRIGDYVLDGSIRGELNRLRQQLLT